jgi:hypothetical protein
MFRIIKLTIFVFLFQYILFTPSAHADKAAQASQILNYFRSNCSMVSDWTNAALSQTQAIVETLNSIKNDPECQTVSSMLSGLGNLQRELQNLQSNPQDREILSLQYQEQVLMQSLLTNTDPTLNIHISNELRSTQTKIASLQGYQSFDDANSSFQKTQKSLQAVLANTNNIFQAVSANQSCWVKHPGVLSNVAGLGASFVGGLFSGGSSLLLASGVDLLGQVVSYAGDFRIRNMINQAADPIASTAFQCALENMSNTWCSAEDARKAINLKQSVLTIPSDDPMWVGVKILERELPVLLNWLKKVRAGTLPSTRADADRQNRVIFREAMIRTQVRTVHGLIKENEDIFSTAGDLSAKWSIQRAIIREITGNQMLQNSVFTEIYPTGYAPYLLAGISMADAPMNSVSGEYKDFASFDPFKFFADRGIPFQPSLTIISEQFKKWSDEADLKVQNELSQVLQVSALEVLDDAIYNGGRPFPTPRQSINVTRQFLMNNIPTVFEFNHHRLIYLDTIEILDHIAESIDNVFAGQLDAKDALSKISLKAKLSFGVVLLENRVTRSVRYTLNSILTSRNRDYNDLASQLLAADDIVDQLKKYHPTGASNLTAIIQSIDQAQTIGQGNLNSFTKIFGNKIQKVLEYYDRQAERSGEGNRGPNKRSKASLCLKLLGLDKWPKKIPFKLCNGEQLFHQNPKGPRSVEITSTELNRPYQEKACHYRTFLRNSEIFEKFGISLTP